MGQRPALPLTSFPILPYSFPNHEALTTSACVNGRSTGSQPVREGDLSVSTRRARASLFIWLRWADLCERLQ